MKYRKKPVEIEAWRFLDAYAERPAWIEPVGVVVPHPDFGALIEIQTLEGTMVAQRGDWIIRGVKGEVYLCKPDIFELTYEPVNNAAFSEDTANEP